MDATEAKKRPAPRGTAAYPRKRAVTACQTCRARRTKCDNLRPKCGFCLRTGAQCVQSSVDLSSFDPASLHILQRLEELEVNLQTAIREERTHTLDPVSQHVLEPSSDSRSDRKLLLPTEPEALYNAIHFQEHRSSLLSSLKLTDQGATSPTLSARSASIDADLDGATCRRLLDKFFSYVHVKNPILQEGETRRLVHNVTMSGLDWSAQSCLVLLICALGATATPFGPSDSVAPGTPAYLLGEAYFNAAKKRMGSCLIDGGLLEAQCLFLAGVYLMNNFRAFDAWRLFSQSLAACQSFDFETPATDLLASPTDSPQSADEAAKQSIYWSAWKSEQELRTMFEMRDFPTSSQRLYPFFFPTPPVSSPDAEGMDDIQARERLGWYFYLTEISLHRLYRRVAKETLTETATPERSLHHALADALSDKLREVESWSDSLPSPMSLKTDPVEDDVCKFVLRGHLHNFYEMIYWPFVALLTTEDKAPRGVVEQSLLDPRLLELAQVGLELHVERIRVNAPGFTHRHHGTWGMIRSCTRSALVLVKAAMVSSTKAGLTMPPDWDQAVREVIQLNQYWRGEVADSRQHLLILEHAMGLL